MTKQLTTQNATITTAAVEVKSLTITGKQVTLAVFRQLREARLIAPDGTLNGTPWGYVNYCPEKKVTRDDGSGDIIECASTDHRHVVWQMGTELRRSRVSPPETWRTGFWSDWTDTFAQASYCTNQHRQPEWLTSVLREGWNEHDFMHDGLRCTACATLERPYEPGHVCWTLEDLEAARVALSAEVVVEKQARVRRRDAWQAMLDLPQLFIAV
ncbi:hypothetical protein [Yinghuangia sp. YIM S10712]|uniref:hypothetical protein n=1 Tax=Yinghuangia sp. YIM S10712 TaxID=3436930 RepID=UPI003F53B4E4